jgi:hypothetical protein
MFNIFTVPNVVLILAVIGYIKLIRSEHIKKLGAMERFIVVLVGSGLFGAGVAALDLFPSEYGAWIAGGISGVIALLLSPWIDKPSIDAAEKKNKEREEKVNAALQRTDEPFASKREAILNRARTNTYASDENFERDLKHLTIMLGDEKSAIAVIDHLLDQSLIYVEDEFVETLDPQKQKQQSAKLIRQGEAVLRKHGQS